MSSYQEDFDEWLTMPSIDNQCINALMGPSTHHCPCANVALSQESTNSNTQTTAVEQPALPSIQWQWRDETVSAGEYQDFKAKYEAEVQNLRLETDRVRRLEADLEKLRLEDYQSFTKQTRELGHFTRILRDHVKELVSKGNPGVIVRSPIRDAPKKD